MRVSEINQKIQFYNDQLFLAGYQMGWNSVIEQIEQDADREWNNGNRVTAEVLRKIAKGFRSDEAA